MTTRQKAPSTRRCIKTGQAEELSLPLRVRKHPAPEGALILRYSPPLLRSSGVRKHPAPEGYSRELPCGGCQQRRKTASPTASPLNRPSEPTRTTPPPWAPSSSTVTKASTPGGFMPGELAGFQQASRNRNAYTTGTGQQAQSQEAVPRSPAARSSPTRGTQSTRRWTNIHVPHQEAYSQHPSKTL